jgi:hypothetical protein
LIQDDSSLVEAVVDFSLPVDPDSQDVREIEQYRGAARAA